MLGHINFFKRLAVKCNKTQLIFMKYQLTHIFIQQL